MADQTQGRNDILNPLGRYGVAIAPPQFSSTHPGGMLASGVMSVAPTIAPDKLNQLTQKPYPNYKVIVLDDDFNTFEHVTRCLLKYIPGMNLERAKELTFQVDREGQAVVWVGPLEPAELYHQQLSLEGLTMAPLEQA